MNYLPEGQGKVGIAGATKYEMARMISEDCEKGKQSKKVKGIAVEDFVETLEKIKRQKFCCVRTGLAYRADRR